MKRIFIFLTLLFFCTGFAQSVNDYKAVIIPLKYDFQNEENQYRIQTLIKYNLEKAGFQAFYSNEHIPGELNDRCKLLTVNLLKESSFFITKLSVVLKDCYGVEIFKSEQGRSREKIFEDAYFEALTNAFKSIFALEYNYKENSETATITASSSSSLKTEEQQSRTENSINATILFAQPTTYGYQLIDSDPKVIMKLYKTSNPSSFMASKGDIQGVLVMKDTQWFFEYYKKDQLISESVTIKF